MVTMADAGSVMREALAVAPLLQEHARTGKALRTMPPDVVDACARAGLFTLALPGSLGGLECEPLTIVRVIEELARADGSGGWTVMIGNTTAFTAWLEPAVARAILARPTSPMAGLLMPNGTAVPDGKGSSTVSGRWPFNSGAPHSSWFCAGLDVNNSSRSVGEAPTPHGESRSGRASGGRDRGHAPRGQ